MSFSISETMNLPDPAGPNVNPDTIVVAVDPGRVRVWPGNARRYACLSAENCSDLIDSMRASGAQHVPAVLRRVEGESEIDCEVIAGNRRHFAVSWLRANGCPSMQFSGVVYELADEEAFLVSDKENRLRKDVSDIERARDYAAALDSHFAVNQSRMATKLGVSKSWMSKMLSVAAIPDTVLEGFEDLQNVSLTGLYSIAQLMNQPDAALAIAEEAKSIAKENGNRSWEETAHIPEPVVLRRLRRVVQAEPGSASVPHTQPFPKSLEAECGGGGNGPARLTGGQTQSLKVS
jgi:ParB family transcriptional regulator, chromosome partitioning protein